ncbi:hypothetical protein [Streptomyces zhihengii]|uniref:hypothetical protein n=1 Tax=Streptomyces zhihengii TaxID=1818004 RepID=UPI0033A2D46E
MLSASLMTINTRHRAMPLSFEAFLALHHNDYFSYTVARLPSRRATAVVEQVFTTLRSRWSTALGSPSPERTAWGILNEHLNAVDEKQPCCAAGALRAELLALAALGFTTERSAALTGHPVGTVASVLRAHPSSQPLTAIEACSSPRDLRAWGAVPA